MCTAHLLLYTYMPIQYVHSEKKSCALYTMIGIEILYPKSHLVLTKLSNGAQLAFSFRLNSTSKQFKWKCEKSIQIFLINFENLQV